MAHRIYRCNDTYRDRRGNLLLRCANVHQISKAVFITFPIHLDINVRENPLHVVQENVKTRVEALMLRVMSSLRNRSNICAVAVFQNGEDHPHVHVYMDQSKQMVNTNGYLFDLFARAVDQPVLKSVWNVTGLLRYLMTEGSLVVYTHNDTLLDTDDDTDAPDGHGATQRGKSNKVSIRTVVKNLMDKDNNMDLKSVTQYCLTNHFQIYDQNKVQTAFQNWVCKHTFDCQKADVETQDPFVTLAVFHWIAHQTSKKCC